MTSQQRIEASQRLEELERREALPEETLRDLRAWWQSVLWREATKVVDFDEWRHYHIKKYA